MSPARDGQGRTPQRNARTRHDEGRLARKLGVTETIVRRLLDLDHRSHIGQVELALEQLEYRLVTSVAKVA